MTAWMIWLALAVQGPDTVVVCPPAARDAMNPWLERRTGQGHRIAVIEPGPTALATRDAIRKIARYSLLRAIVLVGDARGPIAVPTFVRATPVSHRFGGMERIATDSPYADLDDDHVPDLAVGRFTVRTVEQLTDWEKKIEDFEQRGGSWRRRVELVAGVGGFSPVLDRTIDQTVGRLLSASLPAEYEPGFTQADWRSPFCPDPRTFHDATRASLDRGAVFWIYMGHGQPFGLDRVTAPNGRFPIMTMDDIDELKYRQAPSIALLFACYTGAFYAEESFAERLVRHRHGPVGAVAASGVTMPYGMAILGDGMAHAFFSNRHATLGDLFFAAKRSLVDKHALQRRRWLHWMATLLSPNRDLDGERREHIDLFQLLGDPLLRLPQPESIELTGPDRVRAGEKLEVTLRAPWNGTGRVELVADLDAHRNRYARRTVFDAQPEILSQYNRRYDEANNRQWHQEPITCRSRRSQRVAIDVPPTVKGKCHLVVYVEDATGRFAIGGCKVDVEPAAKDVARGGPARATAGG